jgi:hypothetical protein
MATTTRPTEEFSASHKRRSPQPAVRVGADTTLGLHRGACVSPSPATSLYVQGATITIYGWNPKLDLEAVAALRGANRTSAFGGATRA